MNAADQLLHPADWQVVQDLCVACGRLVAAQLKTRASIHAYVLDGLYHPTCAAGLGVHAGAVCRVEEGQS